jgi:hypothetical protein
MNTYLYSPQKTGIYLYYLSFNFKNTDKNKNKNGVRMSVKAPVWAKSGALKYMPLER